MATPYVTIVRNVVASSQDVAAKELQASGKPTLVVAEKQSSGRGRSGNEWWQATRGVAASLAFATGTIPVAETFTLEVGLAVRAAIAAVTGVAADLKWPNDILKEGRKVGGILVEGDANQVVVGCGLNLFWPDHPPGTGALLDEDPGPELGHDLSRLWADAICDPERRWDRAAYLEACVTVGSAVTWQPDGAGTAVSIDEGGALVVDTNRGRVTLRSGEVRLVRISGDSGSGDGVSGDA